MMVEISSLDVVQCMDYAAECISYKESNIGKNKKEYGCISELERKTRGKLAEVIFGKVFNLKPDWSIHSIVDGDGGIDFTLSDGRTVDVKSTIYPNGHLIFTPDTFKADIAVLVYVPYKKIITKDAIRSMECDVKGFIPREEFMAGKVDKDYGYGIRWSYIDKLIPIDTL